MPFLARQINCQDKGTSRLLILGNINSDATIIDISQYGLLVLGRFCLDTVDYFMNYLLNPPLPQYG